MLKCTQNDPPLVGSLAQVHSVWWSRIEKNENVITLGAEMPCDHVFSRVRRCLTSSGQMFIKKKKINQRGGGWSGGAREGIKYNCSSTLLILLVMLGF